MKITNEVTRMVTIGQNWAGLWTHDINWSHSWKYWLHVRFKNSQMKLWRKAVKRLIIKLCFVHFCQSGLKFTFFYFICVCERIFTAEEIWNMPLVRGGIIATTVERSLYVVEMGNLLKSLLSEWSVFLFHLWSITNSTWQESCGSSVCSRPCLAVQRLALQLSRWHFHQK